MSPFRVACDPAKAATRTFRFCDTNLAVKTRVAGTASMSVACCIARLHRTFWGLMQLLDVCTVFWRQLVGCHFWRFDDAIPFALPRSPVPTHLCGKGSSASWKFPCCSTPGSACLRVLERGTAWCGSKSRNACRGRFPCATVFPQVISSAASFNKSLWYKIASVKLQG